MKRPESTGMPKQKACRSEVQEIYDSGLINWLPFGGQNLESLTGKSEQTGCRMAATWFRTVIFPAPPPH